MNRKTATIRDVASRAGVSESTVSRVLSGARTQIPISAETRERVRRAAEELEYRPHPGARALSGKCTNLLGLIVREVAEPWFAQFIEVTSRVAKEKGYDLVLGNARSDPEEALALRDTMLDLRYCDGLLLCGDLQESPGDAMFLARMGQDHKLVSVGRGSGELVRNTPAVGVDNRKGVSLALDHLVRLGHRHIACISAGRTGDLEERVDAYRAFMRNGSGELAQEHVELRGNSYEGGYEAAEVLLSMASPPTAIFATDDRLAIGAMSAIADLGLEIPGDVSIVGFDDIEVVAHLRPALTTVREPVEEIGRKAVELLLDVIGERLPPGSCPLFLLEPELIVRDSCAPPAR